MAIEWLVFRVKPEKREAFIAADEAIWTSVLASYEGFLGKEVWIRPDADDEITLVIHWASREAWFSIPESVLEETDRRFHAAIGEDTAELILSREYQIRKFPVCTK